MTVRADLNLHQYGIQDVRISSTCPQRLTAQKKIGSAVRAGKRRDRHKQREQETEKWHYMQKAAAVSMFAKKTSPWDIANVIIIYLLFDIKEGIQTHTDWARVEKQEWEPVECIIHPFSPALSRSGLFVYTRRTLKHSQTFSLIATRHINNVKKVIYNIW